MNTEIVFLAGRIILGGYFIINAYNHLAESEALAGYAAAKGVPAPRIAVIGSGLLLLIGALAILSGRYAGIGLFALIVFLLPVTFQMHAFWKMDGEARAGEKVQFMKNMALVGAILMLFSLPLPWALSF